MKLVRAPLALAIALAVQGQAHAQEVNQNVSAQLDTVKVEAKRSAKPESRVTSLNAEDIEKNLSTDLESLLRYEPGVGVKKDSRFGIGSIVVRGLDDDRIRISVDGVEQADAYGPTTTYLRTGRNTVDLESIEAVQITKGGDVTAGSGALGGAVEFRTKEPASFLNPTGDDFFASWKTGYRSANDQFANTATLANRSGDLESLLVYTHREGHETENHSGSGGTGLGRGSADPGDIDSDNLLAKFEYQLNDHNRVGVVGERFKGTSDLRLLSESSATELHQSNDESSRHRLGVFQEYENATALFDSLRWQLDYQRTKTENGTHIDTSSSARYVNRFYDEKSLQAKMDLNKQLGSHALRYGFNYSDESLENLNKNTVNGSTDTSRFSPKADGQSWGGYIEDHWAVTDRLTLLPAVRYDHYEYTTDADQYIAGWGDNKNRALTAQLGADFKLNANASLFGKYGSGFRAPDMDDLYYYYENTVNFGGGPMSYRITPNPDLDPERSTFLEGGLRAHNDYASGEITLFYNRYRDFIEQQQVQGSSFALGEYTNVNLDNVTIKGVELKGQLDLHGLNAAVAPGWKVKTALAYADGENKESNQPLDSVAPLSVVTGLSYDQPNGRFGGALNLTWVEGKDRSDISDDNRWLATSSSTVVDLTGYYQPRENLRIAGGIFNLTDEEYWVWNDIRNIANSANNLDRYSQPGRNFGVDLTLTF